MVVGKNLGLMQASTFSSNGDFVSGGGANGDRIFSGGSARSSDHVVCNPSELTAAIMNASAEFAVAILNQGVVDPNANVTTTQQAMAVATKGILMLSLAMLLALQSITVKIPMTMPMVLLLTVTKVKGISGIWLFAICGKPELYRFGLYYQKVR